MLNIARALLEAACFLELSEDDSVNPDDAVRALEGMASRLQQCSPEEVAVLREAIQVELATMPEQWTEARKYLSNFLQAVGIES
jgi:hypothetical protein